MSNEMDVRRLIAEVHKRPPLWDVRMAEYKDRTNTPLLWNEIAEVLKVDVDHCKRKWKNLRDAYRAEVRRTDRRIDRLKANGQYDPNRHFTSKWVYFEPLSFINESKRNSYSTRSRSMNTMHPDLEGASGSQEPPVHVYEPGFHTFCDIKMEAHHTTTDEDDDEDDKLFEQFNAVATPQNARRLSESLASCVAASEYDAMPEEVSPTNASGQPRCKCDTRSDDQVHFLEDLEREEHKLMQSTRKEITRANTVGHVGDADYNFLVSFLPQMKKMSELQNLQFRAKMSELLLNTIAMPTMCMPATTSIPMSSGFNNGGQVTLQTVMQGQPMQQGQPQQQQQQQAQQQQQEQQLLPQIQLQQQPAAIQMAMQAAQSAAGELQSPQEQMIQDADMSTTSSLSTVVAASPANWN